jgi:hydroxylaminobenzene mutase
MKLANRKLMWYGVLLFLIGLITGLLEQHFTNMRMALAAHLEGVMNGIFLVALGAIWTEVRLSPKAEATAYWAALYGTYANWLTTTFAAAVGTAAANPIVSAGHHGRQWQEDLAEGGFLSVSIAIIAAAILALRGLRSTLFIRDSHPGSGR